MARKLVAVAFAVPLAISGVAVLGSGAALAADEPIHTDLPCHELVMPADPDATPETVNLFQNMYYNAEDMFMYGRQDDQSYNNTNSWGGTKNKTYGTSYTYQRIQRYPPIVGYDLGHLELKNDNRDWGVLTAAQRSPAYAQSNVDAGTGATSPKWVYGNNVNNTRFDDIMYFTQEHSSWGGIPMIALHQLNPVTHGVYNYNVYKPGRWAGHPGTAASMVLPGGELNHRYQSWLDSYVDWNTELTAANGGTPVPLLWRIYHEHSGDWFWWGIDDMERGWRPVEIDEFTELWKYTVEYLQDAGVHNFLYTVSPDRSRTGEPSYLMNELVGNPDLKALLDLYIDSRATGTQSWAAGTRTTAKAQLQAQYDLANSPGFDSTHVKWNDQIFVNFQGIPLDLNPTTGARIMTGASPEFDAWFVVDPVTGTSKFEDYFWNKWTEGFAGPDYVDVYGLDNYWENNTTGHNYHPYNSQGAKLQMQFRSSLNTIAKHARQDGKISGLAEGGFTAANLIPWLVDYDGTDFPYLKYVSFYVAWVGPQFQDTNLALARDHNAFRWIVDPARATIPNMLPDWKNMKVGCWLQKGDIDVELEVPEYLGGLGIEFTDSSMSLGTVGLSADKVFWEGSGFLPAIVIEDMRAADPSLGWDATITAGDVVIGPGSLDGKAFGIVPEVISSAWGQTVTAGLPKEAWFEGFKTPGTNLATAAAGASRGVAELGGEITFRAPSTSPAGSYSGVFSVTIL